MAFLDKTGLEHLWAHIVSKINDAKIIVDDALSSTSTNPVQNKVINATISNLSRLVNDAVDTASGAVATHNTSNTAHTDLRALIEGLTNRLNALADSDDTTLDQLSEIVTYIKSNKALIDAVTTGKVSVSDIVDNLTTNASGKVLSAAQGVALKAMIDGIVIPTALPNPQPITINGQRYDGSEAVDVETPKGYTLPIASATQLGGVKPAAKTDEMTQAVGVDDAGGLFTAPVSGGGGDESLIVFDITLEEDTSIIKQNIPADIAAKIGASNIKSWSLIYNLSATTDESVANSGSLSISIGKEGLSNRYGFYGVNANSDAVPEFGGKSVVGFVTYDYYQPQKIFEQTSGRNYGRYAFFFMKPSNIYQGNQGNNFHSISATLTSENFFYITTNTVFGVGSRFTATVVIGGE